MSNDIVTRLREQNKEWLSEGDLYEKNWQLWNEAADEIERLRADRDRWMQCAERLVESQDEALANYRQLQRQANEAVRGE